jgi:uncharacterized glyoxalase superfamily protein PhnB
MILKKLVPLVTVGQLSDLKQFYTKHFGFTVQYDIEGYLGLLAPDKSELAFMRAGECTPDSFNGKGLTLCFEVPDVDAEAKRLVDEGIPVVAPLKDYHWGDRSIILRDPVGIHLYVYRTTSKPTTNG